MFVSYWDYFSILYVVWQVENCELMEGAMNNSKQR